MAFYFLFAILCALAIGTPARDECVGAIELRLVGVVCCALVLPAVGLVTRQIVFQRLERTPEDARQHLRIYVQVERTFPAIWCLTSFAILFICHWRQLVRSDLGYLDRILIEDLLLLAPMTVPWILLWCVQYDIESWKSRRSSASQTNDLRTDAVQPSTSHMPWSQHAVIVRAPLSRFLFWNSRVAFALQQSRVLFGIGIVPMLLVSFCWDVGQRFFPGIDRHPVGWATMLIPLAGLFVLFPELLRHLWPTERLADSSLRTQLLDAAESTHRNVCDILVWETANQLPNAAVVGIVPSLRYVLLTKSLLEDFSEAEIRATFAHELGHIFFHHNVLRMLALLLPVVVIGGTRAALGHVFRGTVVAPMAILDPTYSLFLLFATTVAYLIFVFGWFCRLLELQADTFACELLAKTLGASGAVHQYVALLDRLASGSDQDRTEWIHPSWNARKRHVWQWHERLKLAMEN